MPLFSENDLLAECVFTFTRSSGPGGQNENKVSTKVELWFDISSSRVLTTDQKKMIISRLKNNATSIRLTSGRERSQMANLKLVSKRFVEKIGKLLEVVPERIATRPPAASKEKRLSNKRLLSEKKAGRQSKSAGIHED
ncbi:MAG TPA: alternative ribosome rescue aminoacyl-tRNA hydrolase ArfB [Bacteroidales bacterium]|nr:alternative ribosome rescue aminoacyl-tRNA hydrolase ArfB [Bacteroidales bacterium]